MLLDELGPYVRVKGHHLWRTGPFLWWAKCGAYSQRCIRALGKQCRHGIPESARGQLAGWKNLAEGKPPRARRRDKPIAKAHRVTLEEWLQELGQLEELQAMEAATDAGGLLHALEVAKRWEASSTPGEANLLKDSEGERDTDSAGVRTNDLVEQQAQAQAS